jgi:hypothetical protein
MEIGVTSAAAQVAIACRLPDLSCLRKAQKTFRLMRWRGGDRIPLHNSSMGRHRGV